MNITLVRKMQSAFREVYGSDGSGIFFAPGRVNLIGEHTDYNGGYVFPCALSMGTYGMIAPRKDRMLRMYSLNMPDEGVTEVSLDELRPGRTGRWTQYPEGVFWIMLKQGFEPAYGADLLFFGDLPAGSGLSSSASIEVLTALMIRETYFPEEADSGSTGPDAEAGVRTGLNGARLAQIGQEAENLYCGMHCGIMDQFASANGRKDHAILLDTNTLAYEQVPLEMGEHVLLIINSGVKHSLVSSAYNDRREECAGALKDLRSVTLLAELPSLCAMTTEQFDRYGSVIQDPVRYRRARHAVTENERTLQAVRALREKDLHTFGSLLYKSHESLRDDYEVSCPEMDFLVEKARELPGVTGSRMTGGGFGGCTVNIVRKGLVEEVISTIGKSYFERFGKSASFYQAMPEDGARAL